MSNLNNNKSLKDIGLSGWIAIILTILSIMFIAQNSYSVTISLFWYNITAYLWIILLAIFFTGFFVGYMMSMRRSKKR